MTDRPTHGLLTGPEHAERLLPQREPLRLTPKRMFLLFGLAFALIVMAFRGQLLWLEREQVLRQHAIQASSLSRFGAAFSARLYDSSTRLASEAADYIRDQSPSPEQLSAFLRTRTQATTQNAYAIVLDSSGKLIASSENVPIGGGYGGTDFARRYANANRQVEPSLRSQLTGAVIYPLTQTLVDRQGGFAGLISINARPDGIRPTAARRPQDAQLSIWTLDGRFIAAAFTDFDANGRAIVPAKPGGLGLPGAPRQAGSDVIQASAPLEGWPLIAVASYDRAGVLAEWRRHILENLALVLLLLLGVSLLVWLGIRTAEREEIAKRNYLIAERAALEALNDRELLLKEIHHRIKNSLLLTSSLIYLQSREFKEPEVRAAFESTQRRLSSIGLVHDALYSGGDLTNVDLASYLDKLIGEVAAGFGAAKRGVAVMIDVEPMMVAADRAMPVALILTEVLTNAFKYAFNGRAGGQVTIVGRRCGSEIELTVEDDGPGIDHAEVHGTGLGARLIQSLTDQIEGRYRYEQGQGAQFRLTFPAKSAFA